MDQTKPFIAGLSNRPDPGLPVTGMELIPGRAALVVIDPQNDFLSPNGVAWEVVGPSVEDNRTVDNLERLMQTARSAGIPLFISPHYYYPTDHGWRFEGTLERLMHSIKMFDRPSVLDLTGFPGGGADWLERFKPYINDRDTVICSPHKVYSPSNNDLALQLHKRRIEQIILAGMSANLCVESHLRELIERGFEVATVVDATAAARLPGLDGMEAAYVNFKMIASDVWITDQAVKLMQAVAK